MTLSSSDSVQQAFHFKAYEIEELADVYFFRPLGLLIARAARRLGLTPTEVTVLGALIGMLGGALLYDERLGLWAFAFLILYGIVDSADGQLARMTGQTSEIGRLLDGAGGYVTYLVAYVAILLGTLEHGAGRWLVLAACLAGVATMVQAQMYDYHRTSYAQAVVKGEPPQAGTFAPTPGPAGGVLSAYGRIQRALIGRHADVERAIAERADEGRVREDDRQRYRACFYWPVRGWNLLGDNTRFYAIGVLAWLHHVDWFFLFILIPMNTALVALWFWQARADRRFLAGL